MTEEMALLDTGAAVSLISRELAETITYEETGTTLKLDTRLGTVVGPVVRVTTTLIAEFGSDLEFSSTAVVAPDWYGPQVILGYQGLIDRVRIAIDPGAVADQQWWCFGSE